MTIKSQAWRTPVQLITEKGRQSREGENVQDSTGSFPLLQRGGKNLFWALRGGAEDGMGGMKFQCECGLCSGPHFEVETLGEGWWRSPQYGQKHTMLPA